MQDKIYATKLIKDYSEKEVTKLDELKELDGKVKRPVRTFAYVLGIIGCLIFGAGMSAVMTFIEQNALYAGVGIGAGVIGIAVMGFNYVIYCKRMAKRKAKYADEIIAKSNEILNQ